MMNAQAALKEPDVSKVTPGTGLDSWLTPGRFAAIFGLLLVSCFSHVLAGFETFYHRDFAAFSYPVAFYQKECFWNGQVPLWNPFNDCGAPFLAQWNTIALYPLSIIYLLFPLSWSLGLFSLGHMFLAGMGMFLLARRWMARPFAAAVAGTIFGFNGLIWYSHIWPCNIAALAWMPWIVLCAEFSWRNGGRNIVVASLVGALQMCTGSPEVILQTWLIVGVLWLVQFVRSEVGRNKMVLRLVTVVLLTACLSAAQLLPFMDLLAHSQRDNGFGDSQWSMPLSGVANYLVPMFRANGGEGIHSQHGQYWTASYYLGVGAILLAILGCWKVKNDRVRILIGLACFGLVMALGDNGGVFALIRHLFPQVGLMRYPIKLVVLPTFCIPLLAAFGVCWLQCADADMTPSVQRELKRVGGTLLGVSIIIIWYAVKNRVSYDDLNLTISNALSRVCFLVCVVAVLIQLRMRESAKLQYILQILLLLFLWFDVFTHANLSPTVSRSVYQTDAIRTYSNWEKQLRPGVSRAMLSFGAQESLQFHQVSNAQNDVNARRLGLFGNLNLLDHVAKFDGFFSLGLHDFNELLNHAYLIPDGAPKLRDFLGVSHCSDSNGMEWVTRSSFLPMITGGQKPLFLDGTNALNAVLDARFEPSKEVYLPSLAQGQIHVTNQVDVKISDAAVSAQRVQAVVDASSPAMVVVAQSYYHPWNAYVDGQPTKLWKANHAFQALEVPAGRHRVELIYKDRAFLIGCWISLLGASSCVIFWIMQGAATESRRS